MRLEVIVVMEETKTMSTIIRTYSELITLPTFKERFEYLSESGIVGMDTFGCDRIFYQRFLHSREWQQARNWVIVRDGGFDLAHEDYPISGPIIVHHINPTTMKDIENGSSKLFDPENLICCWDITHKAIHYGSYELINRELVERTENDTCPWKKGGSFR